jgi:hypothetical protein
VPGFGRADRAEAALSKEKISMEIKHSLIADAQLYVVEDIPKPPFACLAYVVAMEAPAGHPYANHVILVPHDPNFMAFLFTPDGSLEGMPYEQVIKLAVESYESDVPGGMPGEERPRGRTKLTS